MDRSGANIPKVEFRIPISANDKYLRMVHYFLESMQVFAGPLAKTAHCVISVSRDEPYRDLYSEYPWTKMYSVEFRWIASDLFEKYEYDGTGLDRYYVKSDADVIVFCDADILIAGDFDEIIWRTYREKIELGFIAHVSPFNQPEFKDTPSDKWWAALYHRGDLTTPEMTQAHTGWELMGSSNAIGHKNCPYYFNYGFIVTLREYADKIATTFESELEIVDSILETWFKSQIANTLSYTRHEIPCDTFSINYNFPLHVPENEMRRISPDKDGKNSPEDIKIFHYLGNGDFNREDFLTEQSLRAALNRRSTGSRQVFRDRLQTIHERLNAAIDPNIGNTIIDCQNE